jgi:FkbM family methyltransferase
MSLRGIVGRIVNVPAGLVGLEIRQSYPELRSLPSYGIRTVLDIGANCGQYHRLLRPLVPGAIIHCFEPLLEPFEILRKRLKADPRARAWRVALGDSNGVSAMYKNASTPSSSFLSMTEEHMRVFPHTAHWTCEEVEVTTLDGWANSQDLEAPIFVKIDVQGYEGRVIQGGSSTIRRAELLLVEVSFVKLYACQCLLEELYDRVRELGFRCAGMSNLLCNPESGRTLQADALFIKS